MTFQKLRFTGPGEAPYQLGQPLSVYDGSVLLGTLDPVILRQDGTEIHIEAFAPTRVVLSEPRHIGRLILFELCAYVSEHFHQIQAISFSFSRPIRALGGPAKQATSRAEALKRIGAVNVQVTPRTSGEHVVSGVWPYSKRSVAALRIALEEQRELFRERPIGSGHRPDTGLRAALRRVLARPSGRASR
jgi:hypothetical protein